jgi:hypothetical protein
MSEPVQALIKGSVIKYPRDWMRNRYGEAAYRDAIAALSPADRPVIDGQILAGSWYSLDAWETFASKMRRAALQQRNESAEEFDLRNMREAGPVILRSVYKFLLGLMSPESAIERLASLYSRLYNQGTCQLVVNSRGHAVLRFVDGIPSDSMRSNFSIISPPRCGFSSSSRACRTSVPP